MSDEKSIRSFSINKYQNGVINAENDDVAIEEPLEISLEYIHNNKRQRSSLAITMRTPGDDFNLVYGFLFTEGIIHSASDVISIQYNTSIEQQENYVIVYLSPKCKVDITSLQRHFYTSSSCGVCGKTSIEMVQQQGMYIIPKQSTTWQVSELQKMSQRFSKEQRIFNRTGSIHGTALFDDKCDIIHITEDVGRHNAMDKMAGMLIKKEKLPIHKYGLIVSGRLSFELVQKAWMMGTVIVLAFGAPSSLAIELAEDVGISLIGFVKNSSLNVYTYPERLII